MHADAFFGRVEGRSCSGASMTFTLTAKAERIASARLSVAGCVSLFRGGY